MAQNSNSDNSEARFSLLYCLSSTHYGGCERQMVFLAQKLATRGYKITFAISPVSAVDSLATDLANYGIRVIRVQGMGSKNPIKWWSALSTLSSLIHSLAPSVVHIPLPWPYHNMVSLLIICLLKVPFVVQFHLAPIPSDYIVERILLGPLSRYLICRASAITTVSEGNRRNLAAIFPSFSQRINVIHNGIDFEHFGVCSPVALNRFREQQSIVGKSIVLVVARLTKQKDHCTLIEAAPRILLRHPDTVFLIAGEGPLRYQLEQMTIKNGVLHAFRFLGHRDDVEILMHAAAVVALPTRYEGFPLVVMEGMVAGKAVVVSRVDGVDELIENEKTGLLVQVGDPVELAQSIARLLDDEYLRSRIGCSARERIRSVCGTVVDQWEVIYHQSTLNKAGKTIT
jgi:glycosyltransferase involved in cell wall biosynthesis